MNRPRARRAKKTSWPVRRGAQVVEFAIVAPLLFFLLMGMIEVSRMLMVQQMLTNAAREGARWAVVEGMEVSDVRDVVEEYLVGGGLMDADDDMSMISVSVNPAPSVAEAGEPITVTVQAPYEELSWMPVPMSFVGLISEDGNSPEPPVMTAQATMRRE